MKKILQKDCCTGALKKYIVIVLLVIVQCGLFQKEVKSYSEIIGISYEISVVDYIVNFYKGTIPYTLLGRDIPFNIPGIWSFYLLFFFAVIGKSIAGMLQKSQYQLILRMKTRNYWFFHQNLVLGLEVVKYLFVTYATFVIYGIVTHASLCGVNRELQRDFNGIDLFEISSIELFTYIVIIPVIVMMTFSYLQYAVSIKGNVLIGLVVSIVVLVSSVFYMNPILIGNYLMIMRNEKFLLQGYNPVMGIIICMIIMVVSIFVGKRIIRKKDLF